MSKIMRATIMAAAMLAVAGCATVSRLASYGNSAADANFAYDGKGYSAALHPDEDVILIRPGFAEGVAAGAVRGATLGAAGRMGGAEAWRAVGEHFLAPSGCRVEQLQPLDQSAGYWEYHWRCPPGVDLRAMVASQRAGLRRGEPLRPGS